MCAHNQFSGDGLFNLQVVVLPALAPKSKREWCSNKVLKSLSNRTIPNLCFKIESPNHTSTNSLPYCLKT
jgi:hypothetical protein